MVDWINPTLVSAYASFRDQMKDELDKLGKMDFTGDTNIPVSFIRSNSAADGKLEKYTGATWVQLPFITTVENHIADTALHGGLPIGAPIPWPLSTPPTNFLLMDGSAQSRSTYAALFAVYGTSFGVGDGTTTFNLPDWRTRIPIGKGAGSAAGAAGATFGAIDHTHTGTSHTHTLAGHTHTMGNHTHTGGSHTHDMPDHVHNLPGHSHDAQASGSTINITSSGHHQHNYGTKSGSTVIASGGNRALNASTSGNDETNTTSNNTLSAHTHPTAAFTGRLGNVTGGWDGDNTYISGGSGTSPTSGGGAVVSGGPSTNTTDASGTLTTDAGGTGTTGVNNPPCVIVNWCCKYQ